MEKFKVKLFGLFKHLYITLLFILHEFFYMTRQLPL